MGEETKEEYRFGPTNDLEAAYEELSDQVRKYIEETKDNTNRQINFDTDDIYLDDGSRLFQVHVTYR